MANDKEKVTEKVEDSAASLTANKGQMTNAELELQADSLGSGEVVSELSSRGVASPCACGYPMGNGDSRGCGRFLFCCRTLR